MFQSVMNIELEIHMHNLLLYSNEIVIYKLFKSSFSRIKFILNGKNTNQKIG